MTAQSVGAICGEAGVGAEAHIPGGRGEAEAQVQVAVKCFPISSMQWIFLGGSPTQKTFVLYVVTVNQKLRLILTDFHSYGFWLNILPKMKSGNLLG